MSDILNRAQSYINYEKKLFVENVEKNKMLSKRLQTQEDMVEL